MFKLLISFVSVYSFVIKLADNVVVWYSFTDECCFNII